MAFPFSILSDQGIVEPGGFSVKNALTAMKPRFIDVLEGFAKGG